MRKFYGDKIGGISLHENPEEYLSGSIGYSMGARIFEKHIGVSKGSIKLNKYSVNDKQMSRWLDFLYATVDQVGNVKSREKDVFKEKQQLRNFKRGVYIKNYNLIKKNEIIDSKKVNFQFPAAKNQLTANSFNLNLLLKTTSQTARQLLKNIVIKNTRDQISEIREKRTFSEKSECYYSTFVTTGSFSSLRT